MLALLVVWAIGDAARAGTRDGVAVPAGVAGATGRLNYAGYRERRHCTAFLVAPQIAISAVHCTDALPAAAFHLLTGYRRMQWDQHLPLAGVAQPSADRDVAVLCLGAPAAADPIPIAGRPLAAGDRVQVYGYGTPAVHVLSRTDCTVLAPVGGGRFLLDCPLPPGMSGGPVLRATADGAKVAAVVSRTSRGSSIVEALPEVIGPKLCN